MPGTISFFREKWLEPFQFFEKNYWNYLSFVWIFFRKMPWTISFVPTNSGHFSILRTTPELSFPTAFHFLSSLPCPHMAQWAKKGKVTGGWQSWNWAVWRWNMATTLRGRTSLELPQETHENAEPCLVGSMGQDIKIGTHTFVDFTCHPQPTTKLGKEWNQLQKNSARRKVEPTSLHLQVFLVFFLLVVFAIRVYASATLFKKTSKKRFENNAHKK